MAAYIAFLAVCFFNLQQSEPCGLSTHIEIAHRALEYFSQNERQVNYRELLQNHPDAYQAGSVYPDAFYQGLCMQGKYHYVSEDSHWTPFLKTSINYIRRTYPLPWDQRAQKLVAFLFGIASHQVADVSWHSLDIDQGFLRAMAAIDFHGSYAEAHSVGDFGGDVISQFELDFNYLESKWYIPVKDLFNIYKEYYNETVIDERTIVDCMYILFLQLYGEYFAVSKLYTTYSTKSPFLVERFHEYFLGGVDDMAFWSTNIFQFTSLMLDNGTSECHLPENPIFIQCNIEKRDHKVRGDEVDQTSRLPLPRSTDMFLGRTPFLRVYSAYDKLLFSRKKLLQKTEYYKDYNSSVMISSGADIVTTEFGVYFHMSQWAERSMELISNATRAVTSVRIFNFLNSKHISTPSATYFVTSPYSRLGWALTTADLNQDGWDDLVIGAPGCSSLNHIQVGCVYILYGNESGLPSVDMDLNKDADVLLKGSEPSGRFGSSVAVLDFNVDGQPDLAIGAPSVGGAQLTYTGSVYVYFGTGSGGLSSQPNVTIKCRETYCNLGWTLLAADVNKDKKDDLVIGSPYAPGGGTQRGLVAAFFSNRRRSRKGDPENIEAIEIMAAQEIAREDILFVEEAEWIVMGEHDYAWFGFSLHSHKRKTKTLLMIGSPTWKSLNKYGNKDLQSIGKAYGFYPPSKSASFVIYGHSEQSKMGSSFASGTLYVNGEKKHVLLTGSPAQNTVLKIMFISRILHHAGTSTVYELTDTKNPTPLGTLRGDGEFSRYGTNLLLSDLDGDGLDEIIVTSPLWTGDYTSMLFGSQTGRVYIYNGNTTSTGLLKDRCKSWSSPCPEDWAQYVLISPEEKSRFGSATTTVSSKEKKQVVVAAVRSSNRARLAGAVYMYNLN